MKTEPDVFSISDLKIKKKTLWDGVRNYQARNFMTNSMKIGDPILFYHSNAEPPGIAGLAKVSGPSLVDPSQFDSKSPYFDKKATREKPIWYGVSVDFVKEFPKLLSLNQLKAEPALSELLVLKRGQRLSVQPVSGDHFEIILKLAAEAR